VSEIDQWSNEIEKHIEEADQTIGLLEQWLNDTQVKREDQQRQISSLNLKKQKLN
jgi:hypothetical protein